jgi:tetraacyldisaccharide 4'-kinase
MIMTFRERLLPYLVAVTNKEVGGFLAATLRVILRGLSYVYAVVVEVRVFGYKHRIFRSKSLGCLVISVGNISVGGTGKTPVVEMIARQLISGGRKVAILSRGYKSRKSKFQIPKSKNQDGITAKTSKYKKNKKEYLPRVVSDGREILLDVEFSGDEPYMLAEEVPQAVVLVDKDRVKAAKYAIKKYNIDTVILDDGYQYLRLSRQVNIVLIDCTNPFGRHKLLPRGILREPVKNLNRANIFFLTKTKGMDLYALKRKLNILNPKAEIIETNHIPKFLNDVYSGNKRDLTWIAGKNIVCVSGIANPEGFERALIDLGANIVSTYRFPDHHKYSKEQIIEIIKCSHMQNAHALITTEKDAVRFPKIETSKEFPFYYMRVEIEILSGAKDFYDKICRMCY